MDESGGTNEYLYSKRRKLNRIGYIKLNEKDLPFKKYKKRLNLSQLPTELLQKILNWIPDSFLIQNLRMVSKNFEAEIKIYLNSKFCLLDTRLEKAKNYVLRADNIKSKIRRVHDCVVLATNQYKMVEASIWRYLSHENIVVFCKCGVKMLHYFDKIILSVYRNDSFQIRDHVIQLCEIARNFTIHFERYKELKINKNCFVSGAKLCDILDCLIFAERKIIHENYVNDICTLTICYKVPYAWFSVLNATNGDKLPWQGKQMLMYMRMRNLVLTHTGMSLCLLDGTYLLEEELKNENLDDFLACGYGGDGNEYFYYGCYNQVAYNKNVECMENRIPNADENSDKFLEITVEMVCPLQQAPLSIFKKYNNLKNFKNQQQEASKKFNMQMHFICDFSKESSLPWEFAYVVCDRNLEENDLKMNKSITKIVYDKFEV